MTARPIEQLTVLEMVRRYAGAVAVAATACALALATAAEPSGVQTRGTGAAPSATTRNATGFVANAGQHEPRVLYQARAPAMTITLQREAALLSGAGGADLALRFLGGRSTSTPAASGPLPGRVNYLVGPRTRHRTGLSMYRRVTYPQLWPGIDLVVRLSAGRLHYELVVHPGADPDRARLAWSGAQRVSITPAGALRVDTPSGPLLDGPPRTFQRIEGRRVAVPSRYAVGAGGRFGFEVGDYDRRRPLVIDPELAWSTFLGDTGTDQPTAVAVDAQGHPYVAGGTTSESFPITEAAPDRTHVTEEGFVTKLERDGTGIVWSTFIGGSFVDAVNAVAVGRDGHVYAAGRTQSHDFPVTPGALDPDDSCCGDGFVTKLSPDGSRFEYSTYFGDSATVYGLGVDRDGHAVVSGAVSTRFGGIPTTPGAFQRTGNGQSEAFAAKLNADGTGVVWGTLLGGTGFDWAYDLAVGADDSVYLAGETNGPNLFPVTPGAFDTTHNGGNHDGFVARLKPDGSGLIYASFLGSDALDDLRAVAVDRAGNAYVGGGLPFDGDGLPVTPGAFDTTHDNTDGFVVKVSASGDRVLWGTYLGGAFTGFHERVNELAVDAQGSVYAAGVTNSLYFPTTPNAFQQQNAGGTDDDEGFVAKLDPSGSRLVGGTYIGGIRPDEITGLAVDRPGAVFVAGTTRSSNFPTTPGAYDRTLAVPSPPPSGCCVIDGFTAKVIIRPGPPAHIEVTPGAAVNPVDTRHCVTAAVEDAFGGRLADVRVEFEVTGAASADGSQVTNANGAAAYCYDGPALPGDDTVHAVVDSDGDGAPAEGEPEATATARWAPPGSTPGCKLRGGGRITTDHDPATFSATAKATVTSGAGMVRHRTRSFSLRSIRIAIVHCDEGVATVFGDAMAGGRKVGFRVDAVDGRRQGDQDAYRLRLTGGYDSGEQPLDSGNIRVK